jgi:hypothetical protein
MHAGPNPPPRRRPSIQVLFDVFVHLPFMYFPTFYAVKESVQGSSWSPMDWVQGGCTKYYNNFQADFTKMFMVRTTPLRHARRPHLNSGEVTRTCDG